MMLRWISVCFLAFAIAKWSVNVVADEELDEEERLLFKAQEDVIGEETQRELDCAEVCGNDEQCKTECAEDKELQRRMELISRMQEAKNENINGPQKKVFGIRFPRTPPIPPRIRPVQGWWRR